MTNKLKQQKTKEPEFESDSGSEDESNMETETSVDVGYIDPDLYPESTFDERKMTKTLLKSPFFTSKIGGKPSWLSQINIPLAAETAIAENNNESKPPVRVQCNNCKSQLKFLLQLYAPISQNDKLYSKLENPDDVFHRVLYVFLCTNTECLPASKRALKVYRSQLRHSNEFFAQSPPPALESGDSQQDQKDADDFLLSFYKNLYEKNLMNTCTICGLVASKKCAKCAFSHYCSQSHQVFDWCKENHKAVCEGYSHWSTVEKDVDELLKLYIERENAPGALNDTGLNEHLFPEYEINIEPEVIIPTNVKIAKKNKDEFDEEKLALDLETNASLEKDLDDVEETACDRDFEKFNKRTKDEPTQVVRYDRGGSPFWVTNNDKLRKDSEVPNCAQCKSKRVFEFQINPQLLNYLGIDDNKQLSSVDWAGLYVYTCSKSCSAANTAYTEEFIYKQDFV